MPLLYVRETGAKCGRSCGKLPAVGNLIEPRIPAAEGSREVVAEHSRADLEQQVCPPRRPAHLLPLDHALAHDLIDRRFDEGARDRLPVAMAFPVVRDPGPVGAQIFSCAFRRIRAVIPLIPGNPLVGGRVSDRRKGVTPR